MTTDIHTQVTLENWGFLAQTGQWEILEKAVDIYLEQNPPLIYPTEANTEDLSRPSVGPEPHPHRASKR